MNESTTQPYQPKREHDKTVAIAIGLIFVFAAGVVLTLTGLSG